MDITAGLVLGKPIGVLALSYFAVTIEVCRLPSNLNWVHLTGAGVLGGIGFKMSIYITNLAFAVNLEIINTSKMAILIASLMAGGLGFMCLKFISKTPVIK